MQEAPPSPKFRVSRRWVRALLVGVAVAIPAALAVALSERGTRDNGSAKANVKKAAPSAPLAALTVVAKGFDEVTDIQFLPGEAQRAIVLQKTGAARLVTLPSSGGGPASASSSPVVLQVEVRTESELGLLGLAFSPKYEQNGLFYVNFNPKDGKRRTRVSEWKLTKDQLGKERAREVRPILEVEQPYSNHNAGQLAFGPDGMLYIGFGDGGAGGDPHGHGQDTSTLLGTMLRIDVSRSEGKLPYAVPKDNPFVGKVGVRPEIWAYGLRNPWRYSFDPGGRLIVADVGQTAYEEVDILERGDNLGWAVREGRHCFPERKACKSTGLKEPIFEYPRELGQSITGGYVYTGTEVPSLKGKYVFADFASGRVWALSLPKRSAEQTPAQVVGEFARAFSTFGRDSRGELYAGDFVTGELLRFAAR